MNALRQDIYKDFAEGALKNIDVVKQHLTDHWKREWVESWTVQHMRSVVCDEGAKARAKAVAIATTDLSDIITIFEDLKDEASDDMEVHVGDCKTTVKALKDQGEELTQQGKLFTCTWSVWSLVLDRGKDALPNQRQTLASKMKAKIAGEVGNMFFTGITAMLDAWAKDGIVRSVA
jgi:hypothetical protein